MATTEPEGFAPIVKQHTRKSTAEGEGGLARAITNSSLFSSRRRSRPHEDSDDEDVEPISDDWSMMPEIKAFQAQGEKDARKGRKLGVTWQNLTVKGIGVSLTFSRFWIIAIHSYSTGMSRLSWDTLKGLKEIY